jgi:hypothetical protein
MQHLQWLEDINRNTNLVKELFLHLNNDQLNAKLNQNAWSIAQILEHLIVINESYYPIIKELQNQTYKAPIHTKIPFLVSFFGKFVFNSVEPNRRKKMKTFPIWEPSQGTVAPGIVERFIQHQEDLKNTIINAEVFTGNNVVIHSPASKVIVYKLSTAFDIIVTHESRHINQAKELLVNLAHS